MRTDFPIFKRIDRGDGKADVICTYTPHAKQKEFHNMKQIFRFFAGGMRSGKTFAALFEDAFWSLKYPGNRIVIVRSTLDEIKMTVLPTLFDEILGDPDQKGGLILRHNKAEKEIVLDTMPRSVIWYRSFDSLGKVRGSSLGGVHLEEADELPESVFNYFITRLSLERVPVKHRRIWITSNPAGKNWLWKRFVYLPEQFPERKKDFGHVQVRTEDNEFLPDREEYIRRFKESGLPQEMIDRYFNASFDTFSGKVYEILDKYHVLPYDFKIPLSWNRITAIDPGFRNPTAILKGAVDRRGNIVLYDEMYGSGRTIEAWAGAIHASLREEHKTVHDRNVKIIIDPAAAQTESDGKSVLNQYAENNIRCYRARNAVLPGINRVKEYLARTKKFVQEYRQRYGIPASEPIKEIPRDCHNGIFWLRGRCPNCLNDMEEYQWKEMALETVNKADAPERPRKKDDHGADVTRYIIAEQPETRSEQSVIVNPFSFEGFMRAGEAEERANRGRDPEYPY